MRTPKNRWRMGRKHKNQSQMRDWPEDKEKCLPVNDLLLPLRKIYFDGYSSERKQHNHFTYTGYNIGEEDYLSSPTPVERFTARWLSNEQKFERYLIDNIIHTAFQLGMEQGRRKERKGKIPYHIMERILEIRSERINALAERLSKYEEVYMMPVPLETSEDLEIPQPSDIVETAAPQSGN